MLTYEQVKAEITSMVVEVSKSVTFNRGTIDATMTHIWAELLKAEQEWPANHKDWIVRCLIFWSQPKNRGSKGIAP
mgnify:CR=1 FL=1